MRGAVSLAAALALPVTLDDGSRFEERGVILFVVFGVILATLVLQGLSLPWLIRLLGVEPGTDHLDEEARARLQAAEAALAEIDRLAEEDWTRDDTIQRLRQQYNYRRRRFAARFDDDEDDGAYEHRASKFSRMLVSVIEAQRAALEQMRREGEISDEVARTVARDLDLEESRLAEARE